MGTWSGGSGSISLGGLPNSLDPLGSQLSAGYQPTTLHSCHRDKRQTSFIATLIGRGISAPFPHSLLLPHSGWGCGPAIVAPVEAHERHAAHCSPVLSFLAPEPSTQLALYSLNHELCLPPDTGSLPASGHPFSVPRAISLVPSLLGGGASVAPSGCARLRALSTLRTWLAPHWPNSAARPLPESDSDLHIHLLCSLKSHMEAKAHGISDPSLECPMAYPFSCLHLGRCLALVCPSRSSWCTQ